MGKNMILLAFLALISCRHQNNLFKNYDVRFNIRYGAKFYSVFADENGKAVAIKGASSYHTDSFKIQTSDTSELFRIDSIKSFLRVIDSFKTKPVVGTEMLHSPRVEIFYDERKVYDSYNWNEKFWDLFRPIMKQIPHGFNPFIVNESPWQ